MFAYSCAMCIEQGEIMFEYFCSLFGYKKEEAELCQSDQNNDLIVTINEHPDKLEQILEQLPPQYLVNAWYTIINELDKTPKHIFSADERKNQDFFNQAKYGTGYLFAGIVSLLSVIMNVVFSYESTNETRGINWAFLSIPAATASFVYNIGLNFFSFIHIPRLVFQFFRNTQSVFCNDHIMKDYRDSKIAYAINSFIFTLIAGFSFNNAVINSKHSTTDILSLFGKEDSLLGVVLTSASTATVLAQVFMGLLSVINKSFGKANTSAGQLGKEMTLRLLVAICEKNDGILPFHEQLKKNIKKGIFNSVDIEEHTVLHSSIAVGNALLIGYFVYLAYYVPTLFDSNQPNEESPSILQYSEATFTLFGRYILLSFMGILDLNKTTSNIVNFFSPVKDDNYTTILERHPINNGIFIAAWIFSPLASLGAFDMLNIGLFSLGIPRKNSFLVLNLISAWVATKINPTSFIKLADSILNKRKIGVFLNSTEKELSEAIIRIASTSDTDFLDIMATENGLDYLSDQIFLMSIVSNNADHTASLITLQKKLQCISKTLRLKKEFIVNACNLLSLSSENDQIALDKIRNQAKFEYNSSKTVPQSQIYCTFFRKKQDNASEDLQEEEDLQNLQEEIEKEFPF